MIILLFIIILILLIEIKNNNIKFKIIFYQDKIRNLFIKMRNENNIKNKINLQHQLAKLSKYTRNLYKYNHDYL